jgi:hypothetical protein
MVSRVKAMMMLLGAIMALGALDATSASAEWLVAGTVLSGSAPLTGQFLGDVSVKGGFRGWLGRVPILGLLFQCGAHFTLGKNVLLISPDRGSASSLTFLGCNTTEPAMGCALAEAEQPIATDPLLLRAFLGPNEEDRLLISAETKGRITSIRFNEANTCAFNSEEPVKGSFIVGLPTGRLDLKAQSLVGLGSIENNSLEIGGQRMTLAEGNALLQLASGSTFDFM